MEVYVSDSKVIRILILPVHYVLMIAKTLR